MEITQNKFIEALIKYFTEERENNEREGRSDLLVICSEIANRLNDLNRITRQRRILKMVHLGRTFGPFGFKVE